MIDYSHYLRDGNYVLQTTGENGDEYVHVYVHVVIYVRVFSRNFSKAVWGKTLHVLVVQNSKLSWLYSIYMYMCVHTHPQK